MKIFSIITTCSLEYSSCNSICTLYKIEEEQASQWLKEKGQKNKQRSTKHTHKTKDRVTSGLNSVAPEGLTVPSPLVAPVVLI